MAAVIHTPECDKWRAAMEAWKVQWPVHCPTCHGWGVVYTEGDWVPYGSTQIQTPGGNDPCPQCAEAGLCPRCMQPVRVSEEFPFFTCIHCGYVASPDEKRNTPGCPQFECYCWEAQEPEWDKEQDRALAADLAAEKEDNAWED